MSRSRGSWHQDWWWVLLFSCGSLGLYANAVKGKVDEVHLLVHRIETICQEKIAALAYREDLQLQIRSQEDPSWVEMLLMRDLGVVPEGWLKVHFKR